MTDPHKPATDTTSRRASVKSRIGGIALRYLLPLGLTVALIWYLFRKVDFGSMMEIIRNGADLWWILLAMGISVVSHIFRAARWRLQLSALGIRPPSWHYDALSSAHTLLISYSLASAKCGDAHIFHALAEPRLPPFSGLW